MKKKMMGIFVCLILVATSIPAIASLSDHPVNRIVPLNGPPNETRDDWHQSQKLLGSNGESYDEFGRSVFIDGDTAIVGASGFDDASKTGVADVFIRTDDTWVFQQELSPSDGNAGDHFGYSVAVDTDTALIGSLYGDGVVTGSGCVYVFTRTGYTWTQQAKLIPSDGAAGDGFGCSVSLDGDIALVGDDWNQAVDYHSGAAFVFIRTDGSWTLQQKLVPSDGEQWDMFGFSVSVQGNTALIGALFGNGIVADTGCAYTFIQYGSTWSQQQKLFATGGSDGFGHCVSLSGDSALVGARFDDGGVGSAYVFTFSGITWTQQQRLTPLDPGVEMSFGIAVSLYGDFALVGAMDELSGDDPGAAYMFTRTGTEWTQQAKLVPSDGSPGDFFGIYVSVSGDYALIGANRDDDNGYWSGSAYIFHYTNQTQNQPPSVPSNPYPHNGMNGVDVHAVLTWVGGDPDPGDTVSYDVYFGTTSPAPKLAGNQSGTSFNPGTLSHDTTYYWKIVAWDNHGTSTSGPTWYFTTVSSNQSLTKTFMFGTYSNLTAQGGFIVIDSVNLRMFTFQPFQFLHHIAGEKVTFSKDNMRAVILQQFIIGMVDAVL